MSCSAADWQDRQIRQGIANNTKGTAFVVYEDVMDAKQACDKLNGFNFQNRYLVGMLGKMRQPIRFSQCPADECSTLPSTRKDGQIQRRSGWTTRKFGEAEEAAWHWLNAWRGGWLEEGTGAYLHLGFTQCIDGTLPSFLSSNTCTLCHGARRFR